MRKKIISTFFFLLILALAAIFVWLIVKDQARFSDKNINSGQIILFYGQECPHCQRVEEFIKNNSGAIEQKIKIERKEVYHNQDNAKLLSRAAENCGLNTNSIGVPFLTDDKNCYVGENEVMDFIKRQADIK